jgi:multimeric flavodoxin WrbA
MENENPKLVVAINGGPRKGWNTDMLLQSALEGAKEAGAETLCVDLYSLNFRGCVSCFGCKREGHHREGKCAMQDDLTAVLDTLKRATGVAIGTPIYVDEVTGMTRCFLERYIFSNIVYSADEPPVLERGPGVAIFYTMNYVGERVELLGYKRIYDNNRRVLSRLKPPFLEEVVCMDTYQFTDYSKYHAPIFDGEHKRRLRETEFPKFLARAREIGLRLGAVEEPPKILDYKVA